MLVYALLGLALAIDMNKGHCVTNFQIVLHDAARNRGILIASCWSYCTVIN